MAVTAANVAGQSTAASAPVGPVRGPAGSAPGAPRWTARPQVSSDPGRVGDTLTVTAGRWSGPPIQSDVTQVMRCTSACVPAGPSNPGRYTITPADVGSVLWVKETASNLSGTTVVWSARSVGPVESASSATVVLSGGQIALRNVRGATLAFASVSSPSPAADRRPVPVEARVLSLHRARGVEGQVSAWVCSVAATVSGPAQVHEAYFARSRGRPCGSRRRCPARSGSSSSAAAAERQSPGHR